MIAEIELAEPFPPLHLTDEELEGILTKVEAHRHAKLQSGVSRELLKYEINRLGWINREGGATTAVSPLDVGEVLVFADKLEAYMKLYAKLSRSDDPLPPVPHAGALKNYLKAWLDDHTLERGGQLSTWQLYFDDRILGLIAAAFDFGGRRPPRTVHATEPYTESSVPILLIRAVLEAFNQKAKRVTLREGVAPIVLSEFARTVPEPEAIKARMTRAFDRLPQTGTLPTAEPQNWFQKWTREYGRLLRTENR